MEKGVIFKGDAACNLILDSCIKARVVVWICVVEN